MAVLLELDHATVRGAAAAPPSSIRTGRRRRRARRNRTHRLLLAMPSSARRPSMRNAMLQSRRVSRRSNPRVSSCPRPCPFRHPASNPARRSRRGMLVLVASVAYRRARRGGVRERARVARRARGVHASSRCCCGPACAGAASPRSCLWLAVARAASRRSRSRACGDIALDFLPVIVNARCARCSRARSRAGSEPLIARADRRDRRSRARSRCRASPATRAR